MADLFVSLAGDDRWSGRLAEPNAARDDGPLRTLSAAQAAVRRLKASLRTPTALRVELRGGSYELDQPWLCTALDSGFPRREAGWAETWPVTWAAYPGETPVLSGGTRLRAPWRVTQIHGQTAWVCQLPEVARGQWSFRQLWVNGQRRHRPRLPKQGVWQVDRAYDTDYQQFFLRNGSCRFGFQPGQLRADWRNLRQVEVQFFGWWIAPRVWLNEVNEADRIAWFDRNTAMRLAYNEQDPVDFRVENVYEALTEPGEWYLDQVTGELSYLPLPGEDPATAEVVAPRLPCLMRLDGAANLRFEGLTFAHNEWRQPANFADSNQASNEVPAAIRLSQADSCVFHRCQVQHGNTYGVEAENGTIELTLDRCQLRDLGAGGVKLWHGCRRNTITDCEIADGGHFFPAGVGVLIGKSTGNRVEHNHIHDFYYSGVSAGWNWGYGESDGYGNLIEWNHIHDLGKGLLSDMGGIYLLGHAAGTRLRYNHIHDITCRRYGGWCIYTDEGSSEVLIESNLCYRANKDPFHQHYGRHNLVFNNIFAHGGDAVLAYGKHEPHLGLVFERNIFLSGGEPIVKGLGPGRWTPRQAQFHRNLYWCSSGPVSFKRAGDQCYGTQAFPHGYLAEAPRFAPLGDLPTVTREPTADDWARATVLRQFVTLHGLPQAPADGTELSLLRQDETLWLQGRLARPNNGEVLTGALWQREHVELFLKPGAASAVVLQLGLAADGELAVIWHGCPAPASFACKATVSDGAGGWQALLSIPLGEIARAAGTTAGTAWRFLAGFTARPSQGDWTTWQALGHDPEGVVADPGFVDPARGDFRLRPGSPALALGFLPFNYPRAGVRPE